MKPLEYHVKINAPKEKVWKKLWEDESYRKWTAAFAEGSYAESDWKEGSRVKFLSTKGEGMYAVIEKTIPNQQMTFRHLGEIKNGVKEPKQWEDATESYHLEEKNGVTDVKVSLGTVAEYEDYFNATFPKALDVLKKISEQ